MSTDWFLGVSCVVVGGLLSADEEKLLCGSPSSDVGLALYWLDVYSE